MTEPTAFFAERQLYPIEDLNWDTIRACYGAVARSAVLKVSPLTLGCVPPSSKTLAHIVPQQEPPRSSGICPGTPGRWDRARGANPCAEPQAFGRAVSRFRMRTVSPADSQGCSFGPFAGLVLVFGPGGGVNEQTEHVTKLPGGRTADRLAAVQLLLLADRDQKAHDILLATVLERLESGPKTFDELLLQIREAWPGVSLSRPLLMSTISAAQDAGLLLPVDPGMLTGAAWTLGTTGRQDIEAAQGWAADILDRTASQVADEARRVLGSANTSDVVRWSEILLDVLVMGIAKALTADGGGFRVVGDA